MARLEVNIPDLGMETEEIKFAGWLKNAGDYVHAGEDLFEVEADKATVVCEAEESGFLHEVLVTDGGVTTGQTVGYLDVR
jgi:2-oxoglutarate dehydrogenase E2 component (dihydrolipoamide succinyltransferase)